MVPSVEQTADLSRALRLPLRNRSVPSSYDGSGDAPGAFGRNDWTAAPWIAPPSAAPLTFAALGAALCPSESLSVASRARGHSPLVLRQSIPRTVCHFRHQHW